MESFFRISVLLLLVLLLLLFLWGFRRLRGLLQKKENRPRPDPDATVDTVLASYVPDQVIVWQKPDVSDEAYNAWKTNLLLLHPNVAVAKICETCDKNLELWQGDNVTTVISDEGTTGTSGDNKGKPVLSGGGNAVANFSLNFIIDFPEPPACVPPPAKCYKTAPPKQYDKPPITVAVLDTGLSPELKAAYTPPVVISCMDAGARGWNFAGKNDDTADDNALQHGSAVAQLIVDQQTRYGIRRINILPVKIHNEAGKGDLFSVLCGFAYAANAGAKVINASFGFHSDTDSKPPAILADHVNNFLTRRNILLVAAAGNLNNNRTVGNYQPDTIRDLARNPFFPASLAKDFQNVFAVTTVSKDGTRVSPSQNYSNKTVDIGINGDDEQNGDYYFLDSLGRVNGDNKPWLLLGSSYAAPIFAGKVAQHYDDLTDGMDGGIDKEELLKRMQDRGLLGKEILLEPRIIQGRCADK